MLVVYILYVYGCIPDVYTLVDTHAYSHIRIVYSHIHPHTKELQTHCEDLRGAYKAKAEAESKLGMLTSLNAELTAKLHTLEPLVKRQEMLDASELAKTNAELRGQV